MSVEFRMFLKRHIEKFLWTMAILQIFGTLSQRSLESVTFSSALIAYNSIFHFIGGYSLFVPWPKKSWDGNYQLIAFTKMDTPNSSRTLFETQFSAQSAIAAGSIPGWLNFDLDNPSLLEERKNAINYVLAKRNPDNKKFLIELYEMVFPERGARGRIRFKKLYSWNFNR